MAIDDASPTVEQLQEQAQRSQQPLDRIADNSPGLTVQQQFWLGNIAVVTVDHSQFETSKLTAVDGVEGVYTQTLFPRTGTRAVRGR